MSLDIGYAVLTLASLSFIGWGRSRDAGMGLYGLHCRDYFLDQW